VDSSILSDVLLEHLLVAVVLGLMSDRSADP
jgi:hypothetical protein